MKTIIFKLCSNSTFEVRATRVLTRAISKLSKHANAKELQQIREIVSQLGEALGDILPSSETVRRLDT